MENLKKCLRSPDMDELEKQIEDYEYDAAGDTLNKIAWEMLPASSEADDC